MKQFITSREELRKLGEEFKTQAFTLIDDFYNLSFWLVLKKHTAKKIVWNTYKNAIYYCDKTKDETDWRTWIHRIFFKLIFDYFNKKEDVDDYDFELIDSWNTGSKLIYRLKENNSNRISGKELLELLKNIPQDLILPLILRDSYNLSYQSIAEYLDLPDAEVESRIYRSRKFFFKILAEEKLSADLQAKDNFASNSIFPIQKLRNTALMLDDELTQSESLEFEKKLGKEPYLKVEFEIQEFVKQLLSKAIFKRNAPASLKRKIKKDAIKRFYLKI